MAATQMKALRVKEGERQASLETVDIPTVGPQDVLIKVKAVGLQPGPFILAKTGLLKNLPVTLGHEVAGEVQQVGELVATVQVGARVRVHAGLSCRACDYCLTDRDQMCGQAGVMGMQGFGTEVPLFTRYRDGGLAEFMRVPEWLVDTISDHVSFEVGAKVQDLATAYNVLKQAYLRPGSTVIITAPTGAMGVSILKIAYFFGVQRLILVGRSTERMESVKKLTSIKTDIVGTDKLSEEDIAKGALVGRLNGLIPQGADAIIDLLNSGPLISQVIHALRFNGVLVHLGGNLSKLEVPLLLMMVNCWRILGSRMHSRNDALTVLKWLSDERLQAEELITHRWKFEDINQAIAQLQERSSPIWMGVINL